MTLLFPRDDEARKDRDHGAVHRHRDRDFIKRDAIKEDFHILDAVDGHTRLAHISFDARVIAVIATVRGKVEGD